MRKLFTICMALTLVLCIGSLNAQTFDREKGVSQTKELTAVSALKANPVIPHRGSITDDVEGHPAFMINSPGTIPWSYYNGNGGRTWKVQGINFPGQNEPMAYIVFNPSQTTPPTTTNYPSHSGSQFFACFCPETGAADAWIISPAFTVESNATISFWASILSAIYHESFKVSISTTGNAPADFTTTISPGVVVVTSNSWTQYTYNIPNDAKHVAITCVSNDKFALLIDDISINGIFVLDPCPAITNLEAEIQGTDVKLTWDAAEGEPLGYKVYDGASVLGTVTTTEYIAKHLSVGVHTLGVEALYADDCEPVKVTTKVDMPEALNPIKNLNGTCVDGELNLTWTKPDDNFGDWLTYVAGDYKDGIGIGAPINTMFVNRWSPADLAAKGITTGSELTKITHFFNSQFSGDRKIEAASFIIKVWQGASSTAAGTEKFSSVTMNFPGDIIDYEWNELILPTPVVIDASLELWFGVHVNMTVGNGSPAAYCAGGFLPGVNMMYYYDEWKNVETLVTGFNYGNWAIKGFVVSEDPIELTHYDIYQDDVKLGEVEAPETTFNETDMDGTHNYCVVAVYVNDAQSQKVCNSITCEVGIKENAKLSLSVVPNPATSHITITANSNFNNIEILNFLGQTVLYQPNTGNEADIDINNLSNGIYFVRIISNNTINVVKFVKQ
ncbi:MAG: choice-of-anchor J domain-containing protein [Bacteroidales bacterium]|jgi:hypothetical protein|nr:choice-of-anchor J domain-containing protein [Bacteroidales bacterium]